MRNPKYYKNPHVFNPDRWIDEEIHPFAFIPFAGGARQCIGKNFALFEIKVAAINLISRLKLELEAGNWPKIRHSITTGLQGEFMIKVEEY